MENLLRKMIKEQLIKVIMSCIDDEGVSKIQNPAPVNRYTYATFTLTMPGCGSWNGKWSAEKDLHVIVKKFTKALCEKYDTEAKLDNDYSYHWYDGWSANIHVEKVDRETATKLKKIKRILRL